LVFKTQPEWLYLLLDEEPPSGCRFDSITVKAIERRIDGVCDNRNNDIPLLVAELQDYLDEQIYLRVVQSMTILQGQNPRRAVRGVVFFVQDRFDPKTEPWIRAVRSVYLEPALRKLQLESPQHPLVAVFQPIFAESEEILVSVAALCYNKMSSFGTELPCVEVLQSVFVNWQMQRLPHLGTEEVEKDCAEPCLA
jgi:hypothetical protein